MIDDINEWGWVEAPGRRLIFPRDVPRLPRALPRYLPPDADRRADRRAPRLTNRLRADALLLARATGMRIGELIDLELDCVHEVPGAGAWLKVPLGKLDTERMVPLDHETVDLIDRIVGAPFPRPARAAPPHRPARRLPAHPPGPSGLRGRAARRAHQRRRPRPGSARSRPTSSGTPSRQPW